MTATARMRLFFITVTAQLPGQARPGQAPLNDLKGKSARSTDICKPPLVNRHPSTPSPEFSEVDDSIDFKGDRPGTRI